MNATNSHPALRSPPLSSPPGRPSGKRDPLTVLQGARDLPTLPLVLQKVREAVADPHSDANRIARIISDDPAMTARILKVVNSAFYAARDPVTSPQMAIARLGLNAVSNIATATSVFTALPPGREPLFRRESFWKHCICTGIAAAVIRDHAPGTRLRRFTRDHLHLAGILHDIGKLLLEQYLQADFAQCIESTRRLALPLDRAEGLFFTCDHAACGAWLGARWKMSPDLLQVMRWHHWPAGAAEEHRLLVMLVHAANYICNLEHIGDGGDLAAPDFQAAVWPELGLLPENIADIVERVAVEARQSEILMVFAR